MATTISYLRDGALVKLLQLSTESGIPCCIKCQKPIPARMRRWSELLGRTPYFCTDACAISWANGVAQLTWVAAAEPLGVD